MMESAVAITFSKDAPQTIPNTCSRHPNNETSADIGDCVAELLQSKHHTRFSEMSIPAIRHRKDSETNYHRVQTAARTHPAGKYRSIP